MELTRDDVEFKSVETQRARGGGGMTSTSTVASIPRLSARAGHAGAGRPLRVDEVRLAPLDALVARRRRPVDDRASRSSSPP